MNDLELLRAMWRIRVFEERVGRAEVAAAVRVSLGR